MSEQVSGQFVQLEGREHYCINNYDRLQPFFMTLVSASDHWLFLSSTGGLTLGRINADHALLPYETVDKIHENIAHTGPITLLRVKGSRAALWQPFDPRVQDGAHPRRLSKHVLGTSAVFEEQAPELGLSFSTSWESSDRFGFVRRCTVENRGKSAVDLEVLDGLRGILPAGIVTALSQSYSSLTDAYKTSELLAPSGLGVFAMTAAISDRPEPQEALRCNTVWSCGLPGAVVTLDSAAVDAFRRGQAFSACSELKGRKGAYLASAKLRLEAGAKHSWLLVAEVNQGQGQVAELAALLEKTPAAALHQQLAADVAAGERELLRIIGASDGLQVGADRTITAHHLANVLFNDMRGGVFADGYGIESDDLLRFLAERNRDVLQRVRPEIETLGAKTQLAAVLQLAEQKRDADLQRLILEYLPITFSRRHGDPSRPWNRFNIRVRGAHGERLLSYEGNWRDIFQNWEALCFSFPSFLPSVIAKFVNASTSDGFNPYRISRTGIDWEVPEPDDPWANIGYWGDHQIVYLLRLLEWCDRFQPGKLGQLLTDAAFCYADVPYRIKPYADLLADAKNSITFDKARQKLTEQRSEQIGSDGRLLPGPGGGVLHVNLAEKLLVPALSKLSNFVIGGGIWLNTQRPEWNDANNALVGYASSMVTLYHLRRYLTHLQALLGTLAGQQVQLSSEVASWLHDVQAAYSNSQGVLQTPGASDAERKQLLDALGEAFSRYRAVVYEKGFSGQQGVDVSTLVQFCALARRFVDHTIAAGRRDNGLYDAYNLLRVSPSGIAVERLYDMLEGQVSALSSGSLPAAEVLEVLGKMQHGGLYREDQKSYLLYPVRQLPGYLQRNLIPTQWAETSALCQALHAAGDRSVVARDATGSWHFNAAFGNAKDLAKALDALGSKAAFAALVKQERAALLAQYESVFHHAAFTGRSGTMYGYEGLGCIYWHMVAKLLLAVQESALAATGPERAQLSEAYYRVREGLCFNKAPLEYGAFPMDPYSHTPPFSGAQQPGMTGQVKEVVLARFAELGVSVERGCLSFAPKLLKRGELLTQAAPFEYLALDGKFNTLTLAEGELGFTYCQVPVIYRAADAAGVTVERGQTREPIAGNTLSPSQSAEVFTRTGTITAIRVAVPRADLLS